MEVKEVWVTPQAEQNILYMARVSNPKNQASENTKLIQYLINNKHWSPFEMANLCVEINTSRAIAAQILRHRSFSFQEFSQRYADVHFLETECYDARRQDDKNRQNSIDDLDADTQAWFLNAQWDVYQQADNLYTEAVKRGIAKECARFLLPMGTSTRLYMNGSVRSWIHYISLRSDASTQKEHQDIACSIRDNCFKHNFPHIAEALGW